MPTAAASDAADLGRSAETLPRERARGAPARAPARDGRPRPRADSRSGRERLAEAGIARRERRRLARRPDQRSRSSTKDDLRDSYPFGLLAVPREQLVRVHASSGTHGKPTVVGYTRADLDTWTELMARCMTMAGVRPGMLIHNANGYGLFTGGLGFHQGGERIGATVVPVSGGFNRAPGDAAARSRRPGARRDALVRAGDRPGAARRRRRPGAQRRSSSGCSAASRGPRRLRAQIERALGIKAVNFYGLSEMCGPGVAAECLTARDGLHVHEDHFLVEVIDPDRRHPGPAGHRRRARVHDADQGGAAADPLPDRRPRRDHARAVRGAGARRPG